jgi:REP element-mobilizing transposase RayT
MKYDPKIHHRRSIRLRNYDYSWPGAYYVTICAFNKSCIFGQVVEHQMHENECGHIVREQWLESGRIRKEIELDAFIVMPNHMHGILWILGPRGEHVLMKSGFVLPLDRMPKDTPRAVPAMRHRSLASWAAGFKSAITSRVRKIWNKPQAAVWQEDYFERIVRDEEELNKIREYIMTNPTRWGSDRYNATRAPEQEEDPEFDS